MAKLSSSFLCVIAFLANPFTPTTLADEACHDLQDFKASKLRSSESIDFCEQFSGKAMLVVNTASQCGFTPQFKGLESLHKQYGDQLAVIGFPSDDFNQEYSDTKKVADVCYVNYGVSFTMLEPSRVRGESANALFQKLIQRTGQQPNWNFNKYLVSADGKQVEYFASSVKPNSSTMRLAIEKSLQGGS